MNKKIKLSLLGTLIAGSALAITLPIVSCSASSEETTSDVSLKVKPSVLKETETIITEVLKGEMQALDNFGAQEALAKTWEIGVILKDDQLKLIKDNLNFTDSNNKPYLGNDVIKSVTFNTIIEIKAGEKIFGPELIVTFNDGWTSVDNIIKVDYLGDAHLKTTNFSQYIL
ncbi:MAG: hypothetical protein ACRDCF_02185 [Mycoplasmoidaceae bacterium]